MKIKKLIREIRPDWPVEVYLTEETEEKILTSLIYRGEASSYETLAPQFTKSKVTRIYAQGSTIVIDVIKEDENICK